MKLFNRTLAVAVMATGIPLGASATPLSRSLSTDLGTVQQVQYGHWNDGPRVASPYYNDGYYVDGAAPYYGDGYYAYGAAPGYVAPRRRWGYGANAPSPGSSQRCSADRENNSSFPSWMCR
jgi:hypothetical protein